MGCVSSSLLEDEDEDVRIVGPNLISHHHIVSLTSTTYGLLATLDQPSSKSQESQHHQPSDQSQSQTLEIINSWELMAGLDPVQVVVPPKPCLDSFPSLCPPAGEDSLILYTTSLRGIRKTFEECNAVRSAVEGLGVVFKERDVSMDLGFREELRELMVRIKGGGVINIVPQVFIKGRYIGGVESVLRIHEEGGLGELVKGLARRRAREEVCDGCGGVRFLPCFTCSGSRKLVLLNLIGTKSKTRGNLVRCGDCNENGLVLCPICS